MSYPTLAKPTTSVYSSSLTLGASAQAMIALTEGSGLPSEVLSRTVALAPPGGYNQNTYGQGAAGPAPVWKSGGFTIGGTNYGSSIVMDWGTRPLMFGGCGFPQANNNGVGAHTIACIFKSYVNPYNRYAGNSLEYPIVAVGGSGSIGLQMYAWGVTGTIPGDKLQLCWLSNAAVISGMNPSIETLPNRWYAAAIAYGIASGGNSTKTMYLYDLTNQQPHPASGVTLYGSTLGYYTSQDIWLGGIQQSAESFFSGEFAHIGLWNYAFGSTDWTNYLTDPWSCLRGTYSGSGSLTATQGRASPSSSKTTVSITWGRTVGVGTGGGTGQPTYTVWRGSGPGSQALTPGSAGTTQVSAGNIISNGNTVVVNDTGLTANTDYWYTLVSTDGTQVLNGLPTYVRSANKSPISILVMSDSKMEINSVPEYLYGAALADNRLMSMVNWSRGGSGLVNNPNSVTNWALSTVIPAAQQVVTIAYSNGSATGGTFELDFPFATPLTVTGIAWNTTAAALQTAINAVLGAGSVTCAGGPLNSAAITITGAGGAYSNASWPLPVFNLANSALTGTTPTVSQMPVVISNTLTTAYSPGTTANNLYYQAAAEASRVNALGAVPPITATYIMFGANDSSGSSTFQANLSALLAAEITAGRTPIVCFPETRRSNNDLPDAASDAAYYSFQSYIVAAVAANPGAILTSTNTYGMSAMNLAPLTMGDGVHESASSMFAAGVGFARYQEIVAALDPANVYPAATKVLTGTTYGPGGSGFAGNVTQPSPGQVQSGVEYGANGTQYTGTLVGGGGGGLLRRRL